MRKRLLHIMLCASSFLASGVAIAQNYLGVHSSNYAGIMGVDLQPASFVDSRFKVDINLFSFNTTNWTNAAYYTTEDMPKWWTKSFKADQLATGGYGYEVGGTNPYNDWMIPDSTFMDRYITRNYDANSTKTIGFYSNTQVDVLNFMFHIKPTIAVGAFVKLRSITNLDDVDPKLAVLLEEDWDYNTLWNQKFNEELLNLNHLTWMEYGLNYSQVLKDDGEHFMKAGVKAKWLSGIAAAYIHTNNFKYEVKNDSTFASLSGDISYGHSSGILDKIDQQNNDPNAPALALGDFMKSSAKFGIGLDLGFVYEWRPDYKEYKYDMDGETDLWRKDKEKYKMRAGISILDIGGMKFQKGGLSRDFSVNTNIDFNFRNAFDGDQTLHDVDESIDSLITNNPSDWTAQEGAGKTFFMALPTAISLQYDYHIWKWFYVNATGIVNVQNRRNPHRVRVPNQVAVTPGFDHAWFGLHFPISYHKYSGLRAGIGTRLGPLTIGVNDFGVLFASGKKIQGAAIYAGLRVPVLYQHPDDIDNDKVSDKVDECKEIPGIWAFKGCPDRDGDGIKDVEDTCPDEAGLAEFQGCPDKDGDKIPDRMDDCPDLAGIPAFKGCPDTDGDSIIDPKDDCPTEAGLIAFNGCPDRDGDGIKDSEDACPDAPGPIANQGCPDTDNDGLFDFVDNCPTEYGPKENNGCPWPDTDKDGLIDKDDECPYLAGPLKNKGCPYQDTDNDGVLDKDDDCPTVAGPVDNKGCPKLAKEEEEILKTAFENLEFNTGNAIIKEVSYPSLNELAELLIKKKNWKLQISGHTDNVGDAQKNLVLSKQRAEAVKAYLVSKGVEASRLNTLFFGETQPIATNDTPEGRQKNRRVEMTVIFQ